MNSVAKQSTPVDSPDGDKKDGMKSIVAASIKDNVEDEKCVVAQYRTTKQQKEEFTAHLKTCHKNNIPIEWVIDIADESNGWFYGTAYHFDDSTQMLHVMVPDKQNPSFDGKVLLDHRTVHLIECVDKRTDALFNKIVRDSVIKIKWDVEWSEEEINEDGIVKDSPSSWIASTARYYIRIANQLLVEDKDFSAESKGFVILSADMNLKLLNCHKNRGVDDFHRLINEGIVQSSPSAAEAAKSSLATESRTQSTDDLLDKKGLRPEGSNGSEVQHPPIRKLVDLSINLKECVGDILDDRDEKKKEQLQLAKMFQAFALEGDLEEGMKLEDKFSFIKEQAEASKNGKVHEEDKIEAAVDDAWYLMQRLEKSLTKMLRSTTGGGPETITTAEEELEHLRKSMKKMKKDLEEKERELQLLKTG